MTKRKSSKNLAEYARQTNIQLIAGGAFLLLIVGDGLIYLIYGPGAAVSGLLCIGVGLVPVVAILLVVVLLNWIVRRANDK
ncbi:MAG: hypothetical protein IT308_02850 [Anaerolineaceae bacterium]|nr:hypothetical protein [Anaerolineaceae bacterium]